MAFKLSACLNLSTSVITHLAETLEHLGVTPFNRRCVCVLVSEESFLHSGRFCFHFHTVWPFPLILLVRLAFKSKQSQEAQQPKRLPVHFKELLHMFSWFQSHCGVIFCFCVCSPGSFLGICERVIAGKDDVSGWNSNCSCSHMLNEHQRLLAGLHGISDWIVIDMRYSIWNYFKQMQLLIWAHINWETSWNIWKVHLLHHRSVKMN